MAVLILKTGETGQESYELNGESMTIGRDADCDILLGDTSVSRNHAVIYRIDERLFRIEDHNSSNGTLVNGEKIVTEFLQHGDEIEIGCYELLFENVVSSGQAEETAVEERQTNSTSSDLRPASLLVLEAGRVICEQPIETDLLKIGASPSCGLVLSGDDAISDEHAQIVFHDGSYYVEDMESLLGTYCNHERIISKELKSGDELSLGRFVLVFEVEDDFEFSSVSEGLGPEPLAGIAPSPEADAPMELLPMPRGGATDVDGGRSGFQSKEDAYLEDQVSPDLPVSPVAPKQELERILATEEDWGEEFEKAQESQPRMEFDAAEYDGTRAVIAAPRSSRPTRTDEPLPRVIVTFPDGHKEEFALDKPEVTVGRLPSNDIAVDDDSISRAHARFMFQGGKVTIRDLDSLNGVQVEGEFVDEAVLRDGDRLALGEIQMEFRYELAKKAPPRSPQPARESAYAETIYDDFEQDGRVDRDGATIVEEFDEGVEPAAGGAAGLRFAETMYDDVFEDEEEETEEEIGDIEIDASGPLDKLKLLYLKLGKTPKERKTRVFLGGLIVLFAVVAIAMQNAPPPAKPKPRPTDHQLPMERGGAPGVVDSNQARLSRINAIQDASGALEVQEWDRALKLVEPVLAEEPGNVRALDIRESATREKDAKARVDRAMDLIRFEQYGEALEMLRGFQAQSIYYSLAESSKHEAETKFVQKTLGEADRLRKEKKYPEALAEIDKALEAVPDSADALKVKAEIEELMKQPVRRGPSAAEIARRRRAAAESARGKQAEAQQSIDRAMLAYAAGEIDSALSQLGTVSNRQSGVPMDSPAYRRAKEVASLMRRARRHYQAGSQAMSQNRLDTALTEWRGLLEIDRKLLGPSKKSLYRQEASLPFAQVLTGQGDKLYAAGKANWELAGAYTKYTEALSYVPNYAPARSKLASIVKDAKEIYRRGYGLWESDPEAGLIEVSKVLKMLPASHNYYGRAQALKTKIQSR